MEFPIRNRISVDKYFLMLAKTAALRSTCLDKQVGCIIVNKFNIILATGYNGSPRGYLHCIDLGACVKDLSGMPAKCPSAHAEQNALIQCSNPFEIDRIYLTISPCIICTRMILNTSCNKVIFSSKHKHPEPYELWSEERRPDYWIYLEI